MPMTPEEAAEYSRKVRSKAATTPAVVLPKALGQSSGTRDQS